MAAREERAQGYNGKGWEGPADDLEWFRKFETKLTFHGMEPWDLLVV